MPSTAPTLQQTSTTDILSHLLAISRENTRTIHLLLDRQERLISVMLDHHSRQLSTVMRSTQEKGQGAPKRLKLPKWMPQWMVQGIGQAAIGATLTSALYHSGGDPLKILDLLLKLLG
jgi:hypothetical protein